MSIGIGLATGDEVRAKVTARLEGRAHWIFLVQPSGISLITEIEKRFYSGSESSSDFEAYIRCDEVGIGAIAVLHKRRMSRGQLLDFLTSECDAHFLEETSPDADIMVLADGCTFEEQGVLLCAFAEWIKKG
jgi:hypothetical protein